MVLSRNSGVSPNENLFTIRLYNQVLGMQMQINAFHASKSWTGSEFDGR